MLILPFLLICFVFLFFFVLYQYNVYLGDNLKASKYIRRAYNGIYALLFFIHPDLTQLVFSFIACKSVGLLPTDTYLLADMSQQCWTPTHLRFLFAVACPMLVLWVVGIPVYAVYTLYNNELSSPAASSFQFLFIKYQPKYWFWSFIFVIRKVVLILIVIFSDTLSEQILWSILLCVFCIFFVVFDYLF